MHPFKSLRFFVLSASCASVIMLFGVPYTNAQDGAGPAPQKKELQQRIDFGNAHILGQSIKSGAVYLMHRKKSDIKNMLEVRENYRKEIIEDFSLENKTLDDKTIRGADNQQK